jgi:lactoylglutathione lyase
MSAMNLIVFPVSDLDGATKLYTALLGAEPYATSPYYVGFRVGDQEIGLDPNGHKKAAGPIAYRFVPDLRTAIDALTAAGATVAQDVTDVGGGTMIALLTDADGNTLGLRQA